MGRTGVKTLDLLTQDEAAEVMRLSPRTLERDRYLERGCPYVKGRACLPRLPEDHGRSPGHPEMTGFPRDEARGARG